MLTFQANEFLFSGRTFNATDAEKIGLVNEIIDDGEIAKDQLIKKIKTEMAVYKMVKKKIFLIVVFILSNFNY